MVCFLTSLVFLVIFSFIYNGFLSLHKSMEKYKITGYIGTNNSVFMRAAALGTWFGDFLTAWMITDMMLQVRNICPDSGNANFPFLYPLKTSENQRFSDV